MIAAFQNINPALEVPFPKGAERISAGFAAAEMM
jgi:hypothetical protein